MQKCQRNQFEEGLPTVSSFYLPFDKGQHLQPVIAQSYLHFKRVTSSIIYQQREIPFIQLHRRRYSRAADLHAVEGMYICFRKGHLDRGVNSAISYRWRPFRRRSTNIVCANIPLLPDTSTGDEDHCHSEVALQGTFERMPEEGTEGKCRQSVENRWWRWHYSRGRRDGEGSVIMSPTTAGNRDNSSPTTVVSCRVGKEVREDLYNWIDEYLYYGGL